MAHERWVKRMDDAVASSWLRGLRSAARDDQRTSAKQRLMDAAPRATASLGRFDRTPVNAER